MRRRCKYIHSKDPMDNLIVEASLVYRLVKKDMKRIRIDMSKALYHVRKRLPDDIYLASPTKMMFGVA